jgi:phage terminase large subunit GpA-like protein
MRPGEFAALMGVNASQVSRWRSKGWLVMTSTGDIDPEASRASVEANRNPTRGGARTKVQAPEGSGLDLAKSKAATEWLKLHTFADAHQARVRELVSAADAGQAYALVLALLEASSAQLEISLLEACRDLRAEPKLRAVLVDQVREGLARVAQHVAGIQQAQTGPGEVERLLALASETDINATKAVRAEVEKLAARAELDLRRGQLREQSASRFALRDACAVYRSALEALPRRLSPQWSSSAIDRVSTLHQELRASLRELRASLAKDLGAPLPVAVPGAVADAVHTLLASAARQLLPRERLTVTEYAAQHLVIPMGPVTGTYNPEQNPFIAEPLDLLSEHGEVEDVVLCMPVQFGKTTAGLALLAYYMGHAPTQIFVALPDEATREKWAQHKFQPILDNSPALQAVLDSTGERDSSNQRFFKRFAAGLLQVEHAGTPARLKLATARVMIIDEYDELDQQTRGGDDSEQMLLDRTTAYSGMAKRLWISSPGLTTGKMWQKYINGTQHRPHVKCPHCGHFQRLRLEQLKHLRSPGADDAIMVWYECEENGCRITESHKPQLFARGNWEWRAERPGARTPSYQLNSLYFPLGMGLSWAEVKRQELAADTEPKRKTFLNSRMAEGYEPPNLTVVRHHALAERVEPYGLRHAPMPVCVLTAGVDTQDDRLEIQILGWGPGLRCWVVDVCKLPGDPNHAEVWEQLEELLDKPIEHASGALMKVAALAVDTGGHRGEAVKRWVRENRRRQALAIFGSKNRHARILGTAQKVDINWQGRLEKRGAEIYAVGSTGIKHHLYGLLASDQNKPKSDLDARMVHFSEELTDFYFKQLTAERWDPVKGWQKVHQRNEALDTWVYAYAATHHPALRLQTWSNAAWARAHAQLLERAPKPETPAAPKAEPPIPSALTAPPSALRRPAPARKPGFSPTRW